MTFTIIEALRITLGQKKFLWLFLALWGGFYSLMFAIPLYAIPGNDITLQFSLFGLRGHLLIGALSGLSSLVTVIQVDIFLRKFISGKTMTGTAMGGMGILSGILSSLFASASCAMCLGALFSFLGFGTILFLAEHRWYILLGASVLLFASLYFASRRLVEGCRSCQVSEVTP